MTRPSLRLKAGLGIPKAYQLYLKGRYYWEKRTPDSLEKAKDYFIQAIQKDPNYVMAYVGLADYYCILPNNAPVSNTAAVPKARATAQKALALDDTLAEPQAVLGSVYESQFELDLSEREHRRGLELDPDEANAHHWYAYPLLSMGRSDEATAQAKRAAELDPLNLKYSDTVGVMFREGPALRPGGRAIQEDSGDGFQLRSLRRQSRVHSSVNGGSTIFGSRDGKKRQFSQMTVKTWRWRRERLGRTPSSDLGDKDQAFARLEKAYSERSSGLGYGKIVRQMDGLHSDPRYAALLKEMGLPQ